MVEYRREFRRVHKSIWVALALLLVSSLLLQNVAGSAYYSMVMQSYTTVTSPPVILQNGTAGTSTIYTNSTSAKVSVSGYGYDFVDNNDSDVDLSADIGTHSNFTAEKYGPDLINDTLTEENTFSSSDSIWLYVNADDESKTDWTRVGTNPYLDAIDYNTNYVNVSGNSMLVGDFGFTDSGKSTEPINSVTVQIYAQQSNSKNLEVFVWDGSSWTSLGLLTLTTSWRWENYTATTVLDTWAKIDGAKIYLRTTSGAGTYEVDCARLQVDYTFYTPPNYELDLEVQWTSVDFDETYEELCIKTGTFSGSEDIMVYAWNVSTSDWHFLYNLTANNWNNVSVTDWLNNENFTARFLGGNESSDTSQDSWNIDATLLHLWTIESTCDYVDNNTFDADSSADKGTHSNFTAQQYGPDSVYDTLTEENTGAGGGEIIEDYVDNEDSDMDSSSDLGDLTDFTNMTAYDANMANLTETTEGADGDWGDTNNPGGTSSAQSTARAMGGTSPDVDSMTLTSISVWWGGTGTGRLAVYQGGALDNPTGATLVWDAGEVAIPETAGWVTISGGSASLAKNTPTWLAFKCNDANHFYETSWDSASDFQSGLGRAQLNDEGAASTDVWDATIGAFTFDDYWYDLYINYTVPTNYQLDQEVQFTDVIDFLATEKLCIYAGSFGGTEDINVTYWTGSSWSSIASDLTASSWNNYTVSLTSATFTIKFGGSTTTSDSVQDYWLIDAVLLQVSGAGSKEDAVDNDTSNVDSSDPEDQGTLGSFDNMKTKDGMATLTEARNNTYSLDATGGYMIIGDGTPDWGSTTGTISFWIQWDTVANRSWGQHDNMETRFSVSNLVVDWGVAGSITSSTGFTAGKWYFIAIVWDDTTDDLYLYVGDQDNAPTEDTYLSTWTNNVTSVGVTQNNFMASKSGVEPTDGHGEDLRYWNTDRTLTEIQSDYDTELTGSETNLRSYFKLNNDFDDIGPNNNDGSGSGSYSFSADVPFGSDYKLDQEVQWTNLPYLLPNENLSIYGGTMGAEDVKVDVWNGTGWENVFTDLSSGWNNVSITDWLTSSTFTIRFKGGTETGDPSQDTWQIDVALIHVWNEGGGGDNHELDLEVQWTSASYTLAHEELCIKTGTFSGSEDLMVYAWNVSTSDWHWVMNLTASTWNNVSVTDWLNNENFTIQFLGGTENSDAIQDSWNIDATLLHLWTENYDYVLRVNNTVTDSWQIRLKKYSDSTISRLENCTVYFHNSTDGVSGQIYIENGAYTQDVGPWYNLSSLTTIYIAMTAQANSTATSYVYTYLEIRIPGTTTYAQYIITFEIT